MKLFQDLTPEQEKIFRQWARDNYKALSPIAGIWHPVVQDECRKINESYDLDFPMGSSHGTPFGTASGAEEAQ
jgi:hypothetical protein